MLFVCHMADENIVLRNRRRHQMLTGHTLTKKRANVKCSFSRVHLAEVTERPSTFSGSVRTMVMLVPFTTALPPQNDYSDYAPRNPDANHECRTDEAERLAAEKQEDTTRKPDEEPDEEDFSKVLGMLLNAAVPPEKIVPITAEVSKNTTTVEATLSDLQATTASDALQNILSDAPKSAPSTQSRPKSALTAQGSTPGLAQSKAAAPGSASAQTAKSEKRDTTEANLPQIEAIVGEAEGQSEQTAAEPVLSLNSTPSENFDDPGSNVITANLQTKVDVLPNTQIELQQFSVETTFLSGIRPYESAKDTDAVTQEIMNTLSRAVAASAPTRNQSGVDGLPSGVSSAGLSTMTDIAPFGAENIGAVNSLGTSLNKSSNELLQQAGRPETTRLGNSQSELTNEFWVQQTGSDADRGSNQAATRDSDQSLSSLAPATSSGADGTRLSFSEAITLTLPDLTTSVTSEMRQPLSSQVSRAVMEHLERRTTAESDTITVQLDPPDLGEMVIELSKSKEGLSVRVTAREAVTMDMLLARGSEIENQLRGEKMDLRSLEFLSPDMMSGGAFQGQTSQDSTSRFDQSVGAQRRNGRNSAATQVATGTTTRTGESQHALNFRA